MNFEPRKVPVTFDDGTTGEMNINFPVKEKEKVYIVGCANSKDLVPWDDKDAEFWGVNNLYGIPIPGAHYDRWFEIHNIWQDPKTEKMIRRGSFDFRGQPIMDYLIGLSTLDGTAVYMQKHWPNLIPNSVPYPLDDVVNFFTGRGFPMDQCRYLTNTISYEIALAISLGFKKIGVWGVDMAVGCLAPETRVLTSDLRWVQSGDIEVGDELMGFDEESNCGDGKTRRWRTTKVTANPEVKRPCYRVQLEDGTEIIASEKHGWLTHGENNNRWKTTDQLVTRHHRTGKPTRIVKLTDTWEPYNSWEAGYIAAAFDGEGHLCQHTRRDHVGSYAFTVGFSQKCNPMLDTVESILKGYGYNTGVSLPNNGETLGHAIKGGKSEVMRFLGQFRPKRLLPKFNPNILGELQAKNNVAVVGVEHIGEQIVMGLETEAKTYIAEGFASHNSEYEHQRPSCEYWLGVAAGMGIEVSIPSQADLLKTRFLYGYEEKQQDLFTEKLEKIRVDMKVKRLKLEQRRMQDEQAIQQHVGGEGVVDEIRKIWANLADDLKYQKRGA